MQGVGGPGGNTGAEEVVVVGPDRGAQGEGGGHDWPVVGIAQGTLARFILKGGVDALIENDNVRPYGRKASFGQFCTECRLETATTDERGDSAGEFDLCFAPHLFWQE